MPVSCASHWMTVWMHVLVLEYPTASYESGFTAETQYSCVVPGAISITRLKNVDGTPLSHEGGPDHICMLVVAMQLPGSVMYPYVVLCEGVV